MGRAVSLPRRQRPNFVDSIGTILPSTARLADASGALRKLVNQLETEGAATNDSWEYAIELVLFNKAQIGRERLDLVGAEMACH
jgi:hypothetical protein